MLKKILEKRALSKRDFFQQVFAVAILLISVFLLLFNFSYISFRIFILLSIASFFISLLFLYFLYIFLDEQRQRNISFALSDALLQTALLPKGSSSLQILESFANSSYKELSKEFSIAVKQIKSGISMNIALSELKKRNKNSDLDTVVNYIEQYHTGGIDISEIFLKISDNLSKKNILEADKKASIMINKYTLLFSSAFIVPLLLRWIYKIVSSFSYEDLSFFITTNTKLLSFTNYAINIYIIILAFLTSVFLALLDNNYKSFFIYFFAIFSIALFFILIV